MEQVYIFRDECYQYILYDSRVLEHCPGLEANAKVPKEFLEKYSRFCDLHCEIQEKLKEYAENS